MSIEKDVSVRELNLGDVVRVFDADFGDAMVQRIYPDGRRGVIRAYVANADFQMSAGLGGRKVITYLGFEEFDLPAESTIDRIRRGAPLR